VSFDKALLGIVCCPATRVPLELMPDSKLQRLNSLIGQQKIKNSGSVVVTAPLEEALVTRDGRVAYPVRDGIPVLLEDEGIPLAQINEP
jgi:uncharacterized protein